MENRSFVVFYSWQSYIGGHANRSYIRYKIETAFKELSTDIELLEDSRGSTGAPDIPSSILMKIAKSDIFICDVTPVHILTLSDGTFRAIPNPNVMFELGFAVRSLGWDRILCICNVEYGKVEHLPFDIASHRIITYSKNKDEKQSKMSLKLTHSLKGIIANYDTIIESGNEFDYKKHDAEIFKELMSFASEEEFINSITDYRSAGRSYRWYLKCWDYIEHFQTYPEKRFISARLNEGYLKLAKALSELHVFVGLNSMDYNTQNWYYEEPGVEYTKEKLKEIWMSQEYRKKEFTYPDTGTSEEKQQYYHEIAKMDKEIYIHSNNVLDAYKSFRDDIKKELVI